MTPLQRIGFVATFVAAGIAIFLLVRYTSSASLVACADFCASQGKRHLAAPTGTVARSVEGSVNATDPNTYCTCVSHGGSSAQGRQ